VESVKWNYSFQGLDEWQILAKVVAIKSGVRKRYENYWTLCDSWVIRKSSARPYWS